MDTRALLEPVHRFLHAKTPDAWLAAAAAPQNLPLLLTDHLVCELKAAQTAMLLIRKYVADKQGAAALLAWLRPYEEFAFYNGPEPDSAALQQPLSKRIMLPEASGWGQSLVARMVLLIKEELHHFCQVRELMQARQIPYVKLSASRYAKGLLREIRTHEPAMLVDKLICGAYIEARSCERFAALAPRLDDELRRFYLSLLRSEARHYQDYLTLAGEIAGEDISARVRAIGAAEARLILSPDSELRFHSGIPPVLSYT